MAGILISLFLFTVYEVGKVRKISKISTFFVFSVDIWKLYNYLLDIYLKEFLWRLQLQRSKNCVHTLTES